METNRFNSRYFFKRNYLQWRAPLIASAIKEVLEPKTVIDVGCATGDIVKALLALGVNAYGADLYAKEHLLIEPTRLLRLDITLPLPSSCCLYDLCMCVETLGILSFSKHDIVAKNLSRLGKTVLCCAAPEIRLIFDEQMKWMGWRRDSEAEDGLRGRLEEVKTRMAVKAFYNGVSVWKRAKW